MDRRVARGDVRWITGASRTARAAYVEDAVGGAARCALDGAAMTTEDTARDGLAVALGSAPIGDGTAALGGWLHREIHRLAGDAEVLVWTRFDRVHRALASVFLGVLETARLPYALILESAARWDTPGLLSHRIREVELGPAEADVDDAPPLPPAPPPLPATLDLAGYHATTLTYRVDHLLAIHDRFVASADPDEAALARMWFLRASLLSGLRQLPELARRYTAELLAATGVSPRLREQILLLHTYRLGVEGPTLVRDRGTVLEDTTRQAASPGLARAYQQFLAGLDATWRQRFDVAIPALEEAARLADAEGYVSGADIVRRHLASIYYLDNRDAALRALLAAIDPAARAERPEYPTFFEVVLAWQAGDLSPLHDASAGPAELPSGPWDDRLPGPHFRDYFPWCLAGLRARALGRPPARAVAQAIAEALTRMRFHMALGVSALAVAQHGLLDGDPAGADLVLGTLERAAPMFGRPAAAFLRLTTSPAATLDAIVEALAAACTVPERLTTPYHVVLATRMVLQRGLAAAPLRDHVAGARDGWRLDGTPRRIIDGCVALLDGERGVLPPRLEHQLLHAPAPAARPALDADVAALCAWIDDHWFEPLQLASIAARRGLSPDALTRRFKRALGVAPMQHHRRRRLDEACQLLLETDWDVTDIAHECGYFDSAHLNRELRRELGVTPGHYRERWKV